MYESTRVNLNNKIKKQITKYSPWNTLQMDIWLLFDFHESRLTWMACCLSFKKRWGSSVKCFTFFLNDSKYILTSVCHSLFLALCDFELKITNNRMKVQIQEIMKIAAEISSVYNESNTNEQNCIWSTLREMENFRFLNLIWLSHHH